jgi:redox-sensitive bicupin YhaK (pirin superfamily)
VLVQTDVVGSRGTSLPDEIGNWSLVLFDRGDEVTAQAREAGIRFLLVSGRPLQEPVAWRSPIVMNTNEELQQAFSERRTFIQDR